MTFNRKTQDEIFCIYIININETNQNIRCMDNKGATKFHQKGRLKSDVKTVFQTLSRLWKNWRIPDSL